MTQKASPGGELQKTLQSKVFCEARLMRAIVPRCLQPILKDKIKALASAAELYTNEKDRTPDEYWLYVRERDSNK